MQLRSPLPSQFPITQRFAENHDIYFGRFGILGHNGIDYGTPIGTPVLAVDIGTVLEVWDDPTGYGRYVKVGHDWGESLYAHLDQQSVAVSQSVGAGQQVGTSGNTGNSTGPHLHFGLRVKPYFRDNGWVGYIDPYPYLHEHAKGAIIGPHIIGGVDRHLALLEQWQPRLILVLDPNPREMLSLRMTCPDSIIVGRIYRPDSEIRDRIKADPKAAAQWAHMITMERMTWDVDYWQVANEVLQDWAGLPLPAQFEMERMRLAQDQGYECAIFGFSVGNPDLPEHDRMALWRQVYDALQMAEDGHHAVACHQYGKPDLWGPDSNWYIHRLEHQVLPRLPFRKLKFVVTEFGIDGLIHSNDGVPRGYKAFTDEIGYTKQLLQIGAYLERFRGQVAGYAVFTLGHNEPWGSYDIDGETARGLASQRVDLPTEPEQPSQPEQEGTVSDEINLAKPYGVQVLRHVTTGPAWRCIHVRHLAPSENRGRHNIYIDVVDEDGKRVKDPSLRIGWTWEGRRSEELAPPKPLDKPDSEPAGNLDMYGGQKLEVWIDGLGTPSDLVKNLHTNHPDETVPSGELWNTTGHHSFYIKFQYQEGDVIMPPIDPPTVPPSNLDEVLKENATLRQENTNLRAAIGKAINLLQVA